MAVLKSYVGIGVAGPRGPKGDPGGVDFGFSTRVELEERVVELIGDTAPTAGDLQAVAQVVSTVQATVETLNTAAVKTINGQAPDVTGNVTISSGGGVPVTSPASTTLVIDSTQRFYSPLTIAGPTTITATGTAQGGIASIIVVANGANIPTIVGANEWETSNGYLNTNRIPNRIDFWYDGLGRRYAWSKEMVPTAVPENPVVPSAPASLSAGAVTSNSQVLNWTAPTTGSPATYTYRVSYRLAGSGAYQEFAAAVSGLTSTVTGLAPSTAYDYQVTATNTTGTSPAATLLNASTTAQLTAPGAPASLAAGTPGSNSVPLTWSAPSSGGGSITDYIVQFSATGANSWATFADGTSSATGATVGGLNSGTTYDFRVAAINAAGTGSYSTITGITTASVLTVPSAPTSLAAGTPASTTVPLTWVAPTAGGGAISDYVVQYAAAGTAFATATTFSDGVTAATGATVTGLTASTSYDFRVAAINAAGTGPYAQVLNITTASSGATVPQAITLTAQNSTMTGPVSEVYSGTGTTTDAAIGQVALKLPAGVTGWIQAQHPNTTDASFSLAFDATNGLTPIVSADFTAACATNGTFQSGENSVTTAISPGFTLTGTSNSYMRLYRDGTTGVVTQESSTDGGATWTVRKTFTATSTADLYATIHTVGTRKVYLPRTVNFT